MHEEVQKKITKILEPPPVKAMKPLPKPDDPIRKKRGGRRYVFMLSQQCAVNCLVFSQSEENEGAIRAVQHAKTD